MNQTMNITAVVVIGHGTSDPEGSRQFHRMIETLANRDPTRRYYPAFLELAEPGIEEAVAIAVKEGHRRILCQPALLLAAGHAKNDLPAVLRNIAKEHHDVELIYGTPIGLSAELVSVCASQIRAATGKADLSEKTLLVVGRGTSDPDANSDVSKLARMLEEGLGFAESRVCYFAVTGPRLPAGLDRAARQASGGVVVFPFIMFSGVLSATLDRELRVARENHPNVDFLATEPFGTADGFATALLGCVDASDQGIAMHCMRCKYRAALPRREDEVGKAQPDGHHHHHHHFHGDCHHGHRHGHSHGERHHHHHFHEAEIHANHS